MIRRRRAPERVPDDELRNWSGGIHRIFTIDAERWIEKPEGRLELLGYLLADEHINVAEVRLIEPDSDTEPRAVVRLAENYKATDLALRDIDEAVAAEMAFSLWIRRRDTHAFNRAYVDGIPLFFDHAAAFETRGLDHFMRSGANNGFVPTWRIEVGPETATTMEMRRRNQSSGLAIHWIQDQARFFSHLEDWVARLARQPVAAIDDAIGATGLPDGKAEEIAEMLRTSQRQLPEAMERVQGFLTQAR